MNSLRTLYVCALCSFGSTLALTSDAATLLDESNLVAASTALAGASMSDSFTITDAGSYRLTVTDIGAPGPIASVNVVVTSNGTVVARLDQATAFQQVTKDFNAQPGSYRIHAIGKAATAAQANFQIAPVAGGTAQYTGGLLLSSSTQTPVDSADIETKISIKTAGTNHYTLTVKDLNFPNALSSYDLILLNGSNPPFGTLCFGTGCATPSTSFSFDAAPGDYDLFITATASGTEQAGLLSVSVTPGPVDGGDVTFRVGKMPSPAAITLPAGASTLAITDLGFPSQLGTMRAELVQGAAELLNNAGVGSSAINGAQQGSAQLYTFATAASGTATYSRVVQGSSGVIYGDVQSTSASSYSFDGTVPAPGGAYTVQLKDFGFPSALTSLQAVVSQNGAPKTTISAQGSVDVQLVSGPLNILLLPQAAASSSSLFGVSVTAQGSGAKVLEATQGIGQLFQAREFTVTNAGSYDVRLTDLAFPSAFSELAMYVTRGPTLIGQVFGGGKFSFNATPGDYTLNFTAKAGGTPAEYGLYATNVTTTPPAPVVTLSANPASVAAQGKSSLTWSTTNATSCVASGGWNGTQTVSGTAQTAALSLDTTFTLTCSGDGGSANASTKVTIAQSSGGSGGGGSLSLSMLLSLVLLTVTARSNRRFRR